MKYINPKDIKLPTADIDLNKKQHMVLKEIKIKGDKKMKIVNPIKMFQMFSTKGAQKLESEQEEEQLAELTTADVLKTIELPTNTAQVHKEITPEMEKNVILSQIDVIANAVKNALFSNEITEEQETAVTEEVVGDAPQETVSEETEVVEETPAEQAEVEEQPKQEAEEIEPSEAENVEAEIKEEEQEEPQEQKPAEEEKVEEEQPAPVEEVAVEEVAVEEPEAEIEQPANEVTDALPTPIETPAETVSEVQDVATSDLLKQIEDLKTANAKQEEEIAKMTLSKEVEADFAGVPGKLEDKVSLVFEIKNSALSDSTKDFIFNSLKSLSAQNVADCQEIGHDQEVEVDEKETQNKKINQAMSEHGLTENQAYLYVNGMRSLDEAIKVSKKVRRK